MSITDPQNPPKSIFTRVVSLPVKVIKKYRVVILSILLLGAVGSSVFLYWQYRQTSQQLSASSNQQPDEETAQILADVGSLMFLPSEEPTIATVTDKAVLSGQEFFAQAENDDKVIIFTEAKKAILYRPSLKKIVNVAPLITEPTSPTTDPKNTAPTEPSVTVTLYNGSTQVGVTNVIDDQLVTAFPNLKVVGKQTAQKNEYQGKLVIDLSGKNTALVQQMAETIQGTVGSFPDGENRPSSEILVIVGNQN